MTQTQLVPGTHTPQVRRVLQSLHANRKPGWQFTGYFLGLEFERIGPDEGQVALSVGPHCCDRSGRLSLGALAVLADVAMAAALRHQSGPSARMATLSARLSFTHFNAFPRAVAVSRSHLTIDDCAMATAVSSIRISGGGKVFCTGEATFAVLPNSRGTAAHPLPKHDTALEMAPLAPEELTRDELEVVCKALQADEDCEAESSFIERFWAVETEIGSGWATCTMERGMHVGNRVGDVQGGILLALAAQACVAVLADGWRLADLSASFIAPNKGRWLTARGDLIRQGRSVAYVECRVTDEQGGVSLLAQCTLLKEA